MSTTHAYRYRGASDLDAGGALRLVTDDAGSAIDTLVRGRLTVPHVTGSTLLALQQIARTRFHRPRNMAPVDHGPGWLTDARDPVVTHGAGIVRFEVFSPCCGVYGRVDLRPDALDDVDHATHGTTNVDLGEAMRLALARLRPDDRTSIEVGRHAVTLATEGEVPIVERKVALPRRWVRGLCEVAVLQADAAPTIALDGVAARRFLRDLPRGTSPRPFHVVPAPHGCRQVIRPESGSVPLHHPRRLAMLEGISPELSRLTVHAHERGGTVWTLFLPHHVVTVVLSPEADRGLSGEGLSLDVGGRADGVTARVRALLTWEATHTTDALAATLGAAPADVRAALAVLGAHGLVGHDAATQAWFHRVLPFDAEDPAATSPRLRAAREREGEVRWRDAFTAEVPGSSGPHTVVIDEHGERCTCAWWARTAGRRGPCRHVLAARRSQQSR